MAPRDNFEQAVTRVVWAHSNLSTDDRAAVLEALADDLRADDSRFEDPAEHIEHILDDLGIEGFADGATD